MVKMVCYFVGTRKNKFHLANFNHCNCSVDYRAVFCNYAFEIAEKQCPYKRVVSIFPAFLYDTVFPDDFA